MPLGQIFPRASKLAEIALKIWAFVVVLPSYIAGIPSNSYSLISAFLNQPARLERKKTEPPTPVKRKRALTLPLEKRGLGAILFQRRQTYDQQDSPFFKLPAELRQMIYTEYFGEDDIRLDHLIGGSWATRPAHSHLYQGFNHLVLSLLISCRRIYSEAIPLLYSTPRYTFSTAEGFLIFYSSILPSRSAALRSIMFDIGDPPIVKRPYFQLEPIPLLDYPELCSRRAVRNNLPQFSEQEKMDYNISPWFGACKALELMRGLSHLIVILHPDDHPRALQELFTDTLEWYESLKGRGIDMEIWLPGGLTPGIWKWNDRERERIWSVCDGQFVQRWKEGDEKVWNDE